MKDGFLCYDKINHEIDYNKISSIYWNEEIASQISYIEYNIDNNINEFKFHDYNLGFKSLSQYSNRYLGKKTKDLCKI